jgi:hypothetical protein
MSCSEADGSREVVATGDPRVSSTKPKTPSADAPAHYGVGVAEEAAASRSMAPPLSAAECKALPNAILDHQASALRTRLARTASYAERGRDAAELQNVESELQSREAARRAASQVPAEGVKICKRVADLPVVSQVGAQHWWIKTTSKEVGMGQADGKVPGHGESGPPGLRTSLVDHSKEPKHQCEVQGGVDEACVDRELEVGKNTGTWIPGINDCHTVVNDILDKCRTDTPEKALQDDTARRLREADAGAP